MSMIGKTLGNFQCTVLLGKGGMGEVYRAKDQKLERDVAIKVLPEEFAKDADRVARFQREAKLLASLNHPNIAAIHGLEESDGTHFLVLELIEGDTLADRIKSGPIPVEESLKLALQIAEALEAAHEKGVIHRDLKPANIKVTPDGKVKVLDFGLAKAFAGEQAEVNLSHSPTLSDMATQQGVILGTAAYMSPEQARGKPVDKRTDVWAFGCVFYEMLTGKAAFQGEDVTEILAAVVKSGVNLDLLPANIHPRVSEVLSRCLEKDQRKRYPEIGEAHYEIEKALSDPSGLFVQPVTTAKPRKKLRLGLPWVAAAVVLAVVLAGIIAWNAKPRPLPQPKPVARFEFELLEGQQFANLADPVLAISPDGKQILYCTTEGIYSRQIDDLTAKLIAGTEEDPKKPFFSPDGKSIGYFSGQILKTISVVGGTPVTLCEAPSWWGGSWTKDNFILYGTASGSIMRVADNGGTPKPILRAKASLIQFPQMLPDGKSILYEMFDTNKIIVQSLESGEPKELLTGGSPTYLPTGHIVYADENNLFAVSFDKNKLEVTSEKVPIVEAIYMSDFSLQYAVSDSGTFAYIPSIGGRLATRTLVWVDRNGNEEPLGIRPDLYRFPKISPDGTRVALTVGTGRNTDIWIYSLSRKIGYPLTSDKSQNTTPMWSPDGKRVIFASQREEGRGIYWKLANDTGKIERLGLASIVFANCFSWSKDGKALIFEEPSETRSSAISVMSLDGDGAIRPLIQENNIVIQPQISPDGLWIAYTVIESGKSEVYVRPYPEVDSDKWIISAGGGFSPRWSPDGRELFYRNGDAMMAVTIETKPTFKAGFPEELFRGSYYSTMGTHWDISPDGRRFLMIKEEGGDKKDTVQGPRKIVVVLNWLEELKERVPID